MATATNLTVLDGHTVRPLTDAELAQRETDAAEREAKAQAAAEQAAAHKSALAKLAALGLTKAEINALLGL